MLKSFLLFAAVVLFVLASAPAPARPTQEAQAGKKAAPDGMAKAKKVYDLDCAMCHGATGDGKTDLAKEMSLTLSDWTTPAALSGKTDQQLFDAIRKGSGKMPPEDSGRATNDEVHNLVIYIRKFATAAPAAPAQPAAAPAPSSTPTSPGN